MRPELRAAQGWQARGARAEAQGWRGKAAQREASELPEHLVQFDTFALDTFEVTVGRFRPFVE